MPSDRRNLHPTSGRAADRRARAAAARWRHDGSEARWARSDLRLRRVLSLVFAPVFAVGGALLLLLGSHASAHAAPSPSVYTSLAAACFALTAVALLDLYAIKRRTREQNRWHRGS
ncbi:hypothetical protein [Streptomyces sp. NPDC101206]|uniref:hypothetical protein n=1 Tax=Streptomyces sp. NPDC101206 TaxID=3366128 RepID=UPI0037F817FA